MKEFISNNDAVIMALKEYTIVEEPDWYTENYK